MNIHRFSALIAPTCAAMLLAVVLAGCDPTPDGEIDRKTQAGIGREIELAPEALTNAGIKVALVDQRRIERLIETTGFVAPAQDRVAHVRPLARGVVEKVHVRLGDRVAARQALLTYDNIELGDLIGGYLELRAGLGRLEARRNVADKYLRRAESLIEVEAISRAEYELRQAEYEQAVADIGSQAAELNRVEEKLHRFGLDDEEIPALANGDHGGHRTASHSILRAPFAGIVTRYDVSMGEVVDREDELFTIVDTATVWVLADLYEKDLGAVVAGGSAEIRVPAYPGESFAGTVEYVADFLDPASRTAKVRCVVSNPGGRLKLEMYATVRIPVAVGEPTVAVPVGSLQEVQGQSVIFVEQEPGRFLMRSVKLGILGDEWVEILEGVGVGETVVTSGTFYLKSAALQASIGEEG